MFPQYVLDISQEEEEVLVSLQQRDMKIHRPRGAGENLTIGFAILKVPELRLEQVFVFFGIWVNSGNL